MDITAIQNFLQQALIMHEYDLLKIAGAVLIGYITVKSLKTVSLQFDKIPKDISRVVIPSSIEKKYSSIDYNHINDLNYNEEIKNFVDVLKNSFAEEHLTNLYNNVNSVKINDQTKKKIPSILSIFLGGSYNNLNNSITVYDNNSTIYHELFHLASYKEDDENRYNGFCQTKKRISDNLTGNIIGKGLNEGYTEVLANRYFPDYENDNITDEYVYLRLITQKVEEIVGKETMEGLYLDASLDGLVNELRKYTSDKEIMQFIADTDFINKNMRLDKTNHTAKIMLDKCFSRINKFLIACYANKVKQKVNENKISKEDLKYNVNVFVSTLGIRIKNGNYKYKLMSDNNIKEYINESLEEKKR